MTGPWEGDKDAHLVEQPAQESRAEFRSYVIGLVTSLVLTALAFVIAIYRPLPGPWLLATLGFLALIQIAVQFRFFLHIDLSGSKREDLQLILFTSLLILIMVGGSFWILSDLDLRMMG